MGQKSRWTQNQKCSSSNGWERDGGGDDLAEYFLIQSCLGLGTGTGLSQQEDGINEHSSGRSEVTSRSTEAGLLITAQ